MYTVLGDHMAYLLEKILHKGLGCRVWNRSMLYQIIASWTKRIGRFWMIGIFSFRTLSILLLTTASHPLIPFSDVGNDIILWVVSWIYLLLSQIYRHKSLSDPELCICGCREEMKGFYLTNRSAFCSIRSTVTFQTSSSFCMIFHWLAIRGIDVSSWFPQRAVAAQPKLCSSDLLRRYGRPFKFACRPGRSVGDLSNYWLSSSAETTQFAGRTLSPWVTFV
jgi:hypothetical protein